VIDERFVLLGALFVTVGGVSYLLDTLHGRNQPNKVTWLLWGLAPLMAFAAQVSEGVGIAAVATFAVGFMPLTIFAASFVNSQSGWRTTPFDIICGVLSILGLLLWAVTSDANLAIMFAIIADLLAAVPTIIKAWNRPETESGTLFWLGIVNGAIGLLIVDSWTFENYAFIGYILLINTFLATLITFGPNRGATATQT
jgi:hypothetical protein